MSLSTKYILFQILIIAPFIIGYILKTRFKDPSKLAKKMLNTNLICFEPLIVLWSIWGLQLKADLILLPISGISIVLLGLIIGYLLIRFLKLTGTSRATFLISSSIANHGFTMGGFICYLFLGEKGLGLSFIFISYFMPYIFIVIFPYAKLASGKKEYMDNIVKGFFLNLQNMPIYAVILSLLLHALNIERPAINFPVSILLMIAIVIYYFTLGMNFRFSGLKGIITENLLLACIKFSVIPIVVLSILNVIQIDSSVRTVILIQSFMPAAIYSVVSSILFDLDKELATGLFVFNTLIFITVILPIILVLKDLF